ncbi:MAG TPA: hypothetical protein VJV39_02925 [Dongiaceae bacterium]|nr:hypothetical protein [Dongiaceae bacterium]
MTDEKFLRFWPRTRQRGFWRFAWWRVALIGGLCAIVIGRTFATSESTAFLRGFAAGLVFFALLGMSFIPVVWRAREARYRRLSGDQARSAFD